MVVKKAVVKLRLLVEDGNKSVQCKFWRAPKLNQNNYDVSGQFQSATNYY